MKRQNNKKYAQRARKLFCQGTCFNAPVALVLSGKRTLEEWADVLAQERELSKREHAFKTPRTKAIEIKLNKPHSRNQ